MNLDESERSIILSIIEKFTGTKKISVQRQDLLIKKVLVRANEAGFDNLSHYLNMVSLNEGEYETLVSHLVVRTTS